MDRIDDKELNDLFDWTSMALDYYATHDLYRSLKMSIKYATLLVKAGEVLPTEVAAVITKEYSTGYGYAIAFEGVLEVGKELGEVEPDSLAQLMEANRPATKLLWFCKSDNPLLEEDLQPFPLIDDQFVGCFTGDFSEYAQAGSSHTNEMLAVEKIRQKALKLWKANDSSLETFGAALKNPDEDDTVETLVSWVPENAAIAYLLADGQCAGFAKPDDREQEHPWGWTYGAPETAKVEEPEPAPPPGKVKFSLKKKTDTAPTSTTTKPADVKKDDILQGRFIDVRTTKVVHKDQEYPFELALKQDGVTPIDVLDSDIVVRLPADKDNKDRIHAYFKEQLGYVPHNWKRRPWFKPKGPSNVVKLDDLKGSTSAPALQTGGKDTGTKYIPPPKVVSKEIVKHFLEVDYPKILGSNSEFIQNPDKIWAEEEKEASLEAMMNDKRFTSIASFDMPRVGRNMILQHISGPSPEYWITMVDAWLRGNILSRRNLEKRLTDANNTIVNMTKELDSFREAAGKKPEPAAQAVAGGNSGKVTFSLKKK